MMDYIYELDDSFMHSGVKGQQWGRRRYQNSDGSLTPEGRLHYGIGKMRTAAKNYGAQASYKAKKLGVRAGLAADKYGALAKQRAGEYGAHAKTMAGIAGRAASVAARNYGAQASYKAKKLGAQAGFAASKYGSLAKQRAGEYGAHAKTMATIAKKRVPAAVGLTVALKAPSLSRGKRFLDRTLSRQSDTRYMSYRDAMKANADTVESGNSWINQRGSAPNRSSNYNSVGNSENNWGALRKSKYPDSSSRDAFRNSVVAPPGKTDSSSYSSTTKPFDTTRARTVSIKSGSRKGSTLTFGGHDRSGGNTPSTGLDSWRTLNDVDFSTSYPRDDNYRRRY